MSGARRARLVGGRWHFQHGPIDCIVHAEGDAAAVASSVEHAWTRFETILADLVAELPLLRLDLSSPAGQAAEAHGVVARRMVAACRVHASGGRFITAMAAVAGSVADELVACFDRPGIERAFVNNGGDVALHFGARGDAAFDVGLFTKPAHGLAGLPPDGRFRIDAASAVRGIATSGWRGRSFSLGIADAVTVLATTAAAADAAATVIANAVNVDVPGIVRQPASEMRDDSDLGDRLVTVGVPALDAAAVDAALASGAHAARHALARGRIIAAVLCLQERRVVVGPQAVGRSMPSPAASAQPLPC